MPVTFFPVTSPVSKTYMLFAGWEVRIVKNCDRGLQITFSRLRSQFFTIRTDPKLANNVFIFSCGILAYK